MNNLKLSNGRSITFTPINVNTIELVTDAALIEEIEDGLRIDNIYSIKIGEKIRVHKGDDDVEYTIREIKKITEDTYLLVESITNVSTLFLTPILGLRKEQYLYDSYLVYTYYDVDELLCPRHKGCMYLLYKFSNSDTFLKFESSIKQHPLFVSIQDPGPKHVLIVMKIPDIYIEDFRKILRGKFSETTKRFQRMVIKFHGENSSQTLMEIFNKDESRRKMLSDKIGYTIPEGSELYDKPNLKTEILWNLL